MRERLDRTTLQAMVGMVVVFNERVQELEDYAEPGMRARVVAVSYDSGHGDPNDVSHTIHVDYSQFDEFNRRFETANFWRGDKANATARETGWYKVRDSLYVSAYVDDLPMAVDEGLTLKANEALPADMAVRNAAILECAQMARLEGHSGLADRFEEMLRTVPEWVEEETAAADPEPEPVVVSTPRP